jgi:hypothetical protein
MTNETNDKTAAISELINNPVNRREFGRRAVAGGMWAAFGGTALSLAGEDAAAQSAITDIDILNFALNLEYLEAEFYTVATTGRRIEDIGIGVNGVGTLGGTVGGGVVSMDNRVMQVARDIANEEQMHVRFLRAALGSAAIAKPAINLAALGVGFANVTEFLTVARAFEDIGVTAYNGAAPLISSRAILASAAGIALTEAQHAGVLRFLVYDRGIAVPQLDNLDVPPLASPNGRLFNVNNEGLSPVRTPSQVLSVVYANRTAGARSGGFFPGGFNGTITTV